MRTQNVLCLLGLAAALAVAAPAARALEAGQVAPPLTAKEWVNTSRPINSFAEFQGSVVAVLFFQTTSPDMEKYALQYVDLINANKDRGFAVIGVTRESKDKLINWADESKVTFPIANDRNAWEKDYLVTGHPYVFLIGVYGEIAYKGDGNQLKDVKAELEKCLGQVKRVSLKREETTKTFDKIWRALDTNDFPNAIKFLLTIQGGTATTDDDRLTAGAFMKDVRAIAKARLDRAVELEKRHDYLQALNVLRALEKSFVGIDEAKDAKETLTRFEKDAKIQHEIKAQRAFEQGRALEEAREFQKAGDIYMAVKTMGVTYVLPKAQSRLTALIQKKLYRPPQ